MSILKVFEKLCLCVSSRDEKAVSGDTKPARGVRRSLTPPPVELELQKTEWTRLERECRRIKAEADASDEAKRKLEEELQDVKELLEARGKEAGLRDASIQQLESEMGMKVS